MPSQLPVGEAVPDDGALPAFIEVSQDRPLGLYVHVPFCATRCGYCDFNTYTASELGYPNSTEQYVEAALRELKLAAQILGTDRPVSTIFFGGGTPTLLEADRLVALLDGVRQHFALEDDVEVTTEANPESVDRAYLAALRAAGFNRLSLGMQSARPHVLATLDRTHTSGRPVRCVSEARAVGFDRVSLDLIYGTPGETDEDWRESVEAAVDAGADHISAYALVVEEGTALARLVRSGVLASPDDDVLADRYVIADSLLSAQGFSWYEVSNWARSPESRCLHNEIYWRSGDWWGIGPGAHSHISGVRWWNVKHPAAYAQRLAEGFSPAHAREILTPQQKYEERVLLEVRLSEGIDVASLAPSAQQATQGLATEGLLGRADLQRGRLVLTVRGRLLADRVVRALV